MEFGGSLVVGGRRFLYTYVPTVLQYSTVLLYMCCKQENKADHGHKKGHAPRAQEGHSSTGISRPRTEVLRTRAYFSTANTLLRSRASRGHLNLYILYIKWNLVVRGRRVFCTNSTVAQICCTYAVKKKTQGGPRAQEGTKGHAPRAQEGHSSMGISRPRTKVLRTRAYFSAANTLLRSRTSRGHLNLSRLISENFATGTQT